MAFWNKKDGKTTRVNIDQTNAKIGISHVSNLQVSQIGGTINNGVNVANSDPEEETGTGQNYAIGVSMNDFFSED